MIDICDFAVGLSRQLFGRTMTSERPGPPADGDLAPARRGRRHLAPSTSRSRCGRGTPRSRWSAATRSSGSRRSRRRCPRWPSGALLARALAEARLPRRRLARCVLGDADGRPGAGRRPRRRPAVARPGRPGWAARSGRGSPTGSAARCSSSAATTRPSSRPSADLDLTTRGIVFSAAGTAGQRCTTHAPRDRAPLGRRRGRRPGRRGVRAAADRQPDRADGTLVGPLVNGRAHASYAAAVDGRASTPAATLRRRRRRGCWPTDAPDAFYVQPTIVRMPAQTDGRAARRPSRRCSTC